MLTLKDYPWVLEHETRWMDNDLYGHVNNVVFYSYFDTAVNRMLVERGLIDPHGGALIGYVVESMCTYKKPVSFPDVLQIGVRVAKVGNSSVRYEIGVFRKGHEEPAASGSFVHVYVDRETERPVRLPDEMRESLEQLQSNRSADSNVIPAKAGTGSPRE